MTSDDGTRKRLHDFGLMAQRLIAAVLAQEWQEADRCARVLSSLMYQCDCCRAMVPPGRIKGVDERYGTECDDCMDAMNALEQTSD